MLTGDRLQLVFCSTKFSAWTRSFCGFCEKPSLAQLSTVRLFVSRELLGRQTFSIIAFLVLNLICSLTKFLLRKPIMPWFAPFSFWLHNNLERPPQMIYSASDWHSSAKRLESFKLLFYLLLLSLFLFRLLKTSARKQLLHQWLLEIKTLLKLMYHLKHSFSICEANPL